MDGGACERSCDWLLGFHGAVFAILWLLVRLLLGFVSGMEVLGVGWGSMVLRVWYS